MTAIHLDFANVPGEHCGSTAMRNLIRHYCGLELSEPAAFGLGAGIDLLYLEAAEFDPAISAYGRGITMEMDLCAALGIDYREAPDLDDAHAWEVVRDEVLAGRPTMLSGDIYYLDYRKFEVHIPSHRFVLVGLDDDREIAWIADRVDPEPQPCSYGALAASRNPRDAISTYNLWGKFHGSEVRRTPEEAHEAALARTARRMLGLDDSQSALIQMMAGGRRFSITTGLAGLRRCAAELPGWGQRPGAARLARYASSTIERFGTGGGNFRVLYAAFLREARTVVPDLVAPSLPALAARSAERWAALAALLGGDPLPDGAWAQGGAVLEEIVDLETELFETLGAHVLR